MPDTARNLMIIAGEVSGDLHGASLIKELKILDPQLQICGIGGDKMKAEGMELIYHINKMAFLGFAEIIKHIPLIKRVQNNLINIIKEKKIKDVVLIDYPGFNLNFAKKLKASALARPSRDRMNIKIIYYISPQIWAWGLGRIKKIKNLVDKMLVVFPFEEELYKSNDVNVEFVGHPLIERINDYNFLTKDELYRKFDLNPSKEILLIMPGSREHEVIKIFPEAIKAAFRLANEFDLQIVVACSPNIDESLIRSALARPSRDRSISPEGDFKVIKDHTYDLMKYSKLGIIKSGTSTLEAGLFALPMIIVYRTSYLTYLIGKNLVKLKNIGMVNIISGEKVVPELIQKKVNQKAIYSEGEKILSNSKLYNSIKNKLHKIKDKLGSPGASKRAAGIIYSMLYES